ncbi:MAG: hypothetical protein HQ509_10245 [Candidatus Marinimicrobia bacterium]|nr:hypothetical protein [Candidatus Neomarinimicrobiota bacterium]
MEEKAIEMFKGKIQVIDNGAKWFIPSFIEFQYGVLNPENRAHLSVINILNKQGVCKGLVRGLQGRKDMDMDMDMDKEMDKDRVETQFEEWWKLYSKPEGKKKSLVKWLKLKQPDRGKCLEVVGDYVISKPDKQYRLNPLTYLNGDHWDDEIILPDELKPKKHPYATCKCGFDYKLRPNEIEAAKKKPCPECGGKVEIIYA